MKLQRMQRSPVAIGCSRRMRSSLKTHPVKCQNSGRNRPWKDV